MIRKPPKRSGDPAHAPLTNERLSDLTRIIVDETLVLGPQDEADLIEALIELVERRNAERVIAEAIGGGTVMFKEVEMGRDAA